MILVNASYEEERIREVRIRNEQMKLCLFQEIVYLGNVSELIIKYLVKKQELSKNLCKCHNIPPLSTTIKYK
jgi:hypothetical protein